jgi:hypothetical protein
MANILKRPMFRRGGSVAYGTGITSGLDTPRARYENGSSDDGTQQDDIISLSAKDEEKINPEILKAAYDIIKQKTLPTDRETIADFLTSFGASAGDPTELQTWGSALGKTAQRFQAIQQPKIQAANKYGAQAALASLKGMTKNDLLAIQRKAKEAAALGMFGDPNDPESYKKAYTAFARKELGADANPFLKSKSPEDKIDELAKTIAKDKGYDYTTALAYAKIQYQYAHSGDEKIKDEANRFKGEINSNFVEPQASGDIKIKADKLQSQGKLYKANDVVFDPTTKSLYYYAGQGTFKLLRKV